MQCAVIMRSDCPVVHGACWCVVAVCSGLNNANVLYAVDEGLWGQNRPAIK